MHIDDGEGAGDGGKILTVTTSDTDGRVEISAQIERMDSTRVDVTISDQECSIKGTRQASGARNDPTRNGQLVTEHSHASFERTFTLPADVVSKAATASIKGGKLLISLPKKPRPGEEL